MGLIPSWADYLCWHIKLVIEIPAVVFRASPHLLQISRSKHAEKTIHLARKHANRNSNIGEPFSPSHAPRLPNTRTCRPRFKKKEGGDHLICPTEAQQTHFVQNGHYFLKVSLRPKLDMCTMKGHVSNKHFRRSIHYIFVVAISAGIVMAT